MAEGNVSGQQKQSHLHMAQNKSSCDRFTSPHQSMNLNLTTTKHLRYSACKFFCETYPHLTHIECQGVDAVRWNFVQIVLWAMRSACYGVQLVAHGPAVSEHDVPLARHHAAFVCFQFLLIASELHSTLQAQSAQLSTARCTASMARRAVTRD